MRLVHYSKHAGLTMTDPSKIGTSGVRSEGLKQGLPKVGATYFYREGTEPEKLVASQHKYVTSIPDHEIADLSNDPKDTYRTAKAAAGGSFWHHLDFHQPLLDNGYSGYHNSNAGSMSNVVALLKPHPVKEIGSDPKGIMNTSFGDEHFVEFEKDWPKTEPTTESVVNSIVDRLLG